MKKVNHTLVVLLMIGVLSIMNSVFAQGKYIDKTGNIAFEASEELFEPVKAKNESVTVILNTETSEIAALALMKSFRFKNSLMEEHFNENYIESETFPKATFKGKLTDFSFSDLTEQDQDITVNGTIELRSKEKQIQTILKIGKSTDGAIDIKGSFSVTPEDFDIDIPSVVRNKIAKEIIVSLDFKLVKR